MSAKDILNIQKGDVVSFVGAGGKTSLISDIAREISMEFSVAVTTTTRIYPFDSTHFMNFCSAIDDTRTAVDIDKTDKIETKIPVFTSGIDSERKCLPLDDEGIKYLTEIYDVVLIEADGARGKSLKRPRANEPVVPDFSNKVVWVTGLDVLGRKFSDELVFKPEIFNEIGFDGENEIDIRNLRHALYSSGGYLDKLPDKEIYLVLNKIDAAENFNVDSARLLWHPRLSGLVISGLDGDERFFSEIDNKEIPVTIVILAAGMSERFGSRKLLAGYRGRPLICKSTNTALESEAEKTIVVIPENSPDLRAIVESCGKVEIVENPDAQLGLSTSIRAGLERIVNEDGNSRAMMLLPADMPNIDTKLINDVLRAFRDSAAPICAPFENDRFGHPVIFHPVTFSEIQKISGDIGCRDILRQNPDLVKTATPSKSETQADIDTPADLERIDSNERILHGVW